MKSKQFNTNFWDDKYIYELSDSEKILFAFYFTNEKVNMSGIYEIQDRRVLYFNKNMENTALQQIKKKFEADFKYCFYQDWVYVVNNHKNNHYSSNRYVVASFLDEFNTIPKEVRGYYFKTKSLTYTPPFDLKKITYFFNKDIDIDMVIEKEKEKEKDKFDGTTHGTMHGHKLNNGVNGSLSNNTDVKNMEDVKERLKGKYDGSEDVNPDSIPF